jgi:two-component system, NtrC family, sensor kinase
MRLKTGIFLWVSFATVLPLTLLVLALTSYSERLHRSEVTRELQSSLTSTTAEIDRRLRFEREVVRALADAPAMRQYIPVLESAGVGERHERFYVLTHQLNSFFEAFQQIVPSISAIRVLDGDGNTLVKVENGRRSRTIYEGLAPFPYAEHELHDEAFRARLGELAPGEVAFTVLPQTSEMRGRASTLPMLDAVVPLGGWGHVTGYLTASLGADAIDRILDLAPRLHNGRMLIGELNLEQRERDGVLLYDDATARQLSDAATGDRRLQDIAGGRLAAAVHRQPQGMVTSPDGRTEVHYLEYHPYPNQLVSWIVATRVSRAAIAAPFNRIRQGILLFAGVALALSLVVASYGARRLAGPVSGLARNLERYADGEQSLRATPGGAAELRQLAASFNYMADTLERARAERDRAQSMMLQSAKLAGLGRLAAGIGHEINNPLNNILSLATLIERGIPADAVRARDDLSSLREEALRASRIVRGVLNFARQMPIQYEQFEVAPWIEETVQLVSRVARDHDVRLEAQTAPGCRLEGDRNQLQQVLVNLLLNAIDASPAGARVWVCVTEEAESVAIRVRDEGPGLPDEVKDQIFDPFFTTKPVGVGSGLGLSISLGIVERHEGSLAVSNHPQGGVAATVLLPKVAVRQEPREAVS